MMKIRTCQQQNQRCRVHLHEYTVRWKCMEPSLALYAAPARNSPIPVRKPAEVGVSAPNQAQERDDGPNQSD
eukprot:7684133-Prorocentrum_lima.AAC.1